MSSPVLLYVEDEDAAVFLFESTLKDVCTNVELHRVADGEQALAFLDKQGVYEQAPTPQLVLLDLNLPKVNGFDVLTALHDRPDHSSPPVVVFTSSSLASDRNKSFALGAKEYITKPSNLDSFTDAVRQACSWLEK